MADSNAPEHQDRGLFDLFGNKKEEETHEQHPTGVDPHGHCHAHVGDIHHVVPPPPVPLLPVPLPPVPPVPHVHVEVLKHHGECAKKLHEGGLTEKLHRSNSSFSSSSSDEEGGEKGEKKNKKKGGLKEKLPGHKKIGEKHGEKKERLMEKIKEKLPGYKKEAEKHCEKKEGLMEKIKEKLHKEH